MTPLIVIQARMGSVRFPGKINAPIHGIPILGWVAQAASEVSPHIVIAIPRRDWRNRYIACRGVRIFEPYEAAENDVLGRFAECVDREAEDVAWRDVPIVRLTGDCPAMSPTVIRETLAAFRPEMGYLFSHWLRPLPKGQEVEVFTREWLLEAHATATDPYDREHVCPWMRRKAWPVWSAAATPAGRRISGIEGAYTDLNLSVDTVDDLHRLEALWPTLDRT